MVIARWLAAGDRSACQSCQDDQQVMGVAANCAACPHHAATPERIMDQNKAPLKVFGLCRGQWRVGFSGAVSLDGNVVWRVIDELAPANPLDCFRRVELLAGCYLQAQRKKRDV